MSRIALGELFRRAVDVLTGLKVPYAVYGGIAFPVWGHPVTTDDADFVVHIHEGNVARVLGVFRQAGFHVPDRAETLLFIDTWVTLTLGGRDVDLALGTTDFDAEALKRAVRIRIFDRDVPVVTAEDLILYKVVSHRHKDLGHVEVILKRQGRKLDPAYLRAWAQRIAEATGKFEVPATVDRMLGKEGLL